MTGHQNINGQELFFDNNGVQVKGVLLTRMVLSVTMMLTQVRWLVTDSQKSNQVFGLLQ
ncbi:MAG: hypothetical protein ACLS36_05520 [Streptococcus sp.]